MSAARACERCGRPCTASKSGRRRRCAICRRLICRDCMHRPRMKDEAIMCSLAPDDFGRPRPDDCIIAVAQTP